MRKQIVTLKQIVTELCRSITNNIQREKVQTQIENMSKEQENDQNPNEDMEYKKKVLSYQMNVSKEKLISEKKSENAGKRKERSCPVYYNVNNEDLSGKGSNYYEVAYESVIRKNRKLRLESQNE